MGAICVIEWEKEFDPDRKFLLTDLMGTFCVIEGENVTFVFKFL